MVSPNDRPYTRCQKTAVGGGRRFYRDSSLFYLPSDLTERNSTKTGHMLGSECNLKMYVRNLGYPLLLQIGGEKPHIFDDFATSGNFNGLYLWSETWYT